MFDPAADPIAGDVIAAFANAAKARRSASECYQAAVAVWRRAYRSAAHQEMVVRTEATLFRSEWAIAQSRQLIERLEQARQQRKLTS
jgi:hypothetical protein